VNLLEKNISDFRPISLEEMEKVRLMNRTDTKYIFHTGLLPDILSSAKDSYRILCVGEIKIFQYNSLYYDTEGMEFYHGHHNGLRPRYKVRFREYIDTNRIFLEVKKKSADGRTRKSRIQVNSMETSLSPESLLYIYERIPSVYQELRPSLKTIFKRMTLVSDNEDERITIDTSLEFSQKDNEKNLQNPVICEVKRDAASGVSTFMKILKKHRVYPGNLSKYCLGTILLNSSIKANRFKENIINITKLENEYTFYSTAG
jgi:hypothetical protein